MRSHSYLNTAKKIVDLYDGSIPLALWLKQFFKNDKKFGSRDRKQIAHVSYCYYRLGNSFSQVSLEERLLISLFLCSGESNFILSELKPQWNDQILLTPEKKLERINALTELENIFPFPDELSREIQLSGFNRSFLYQPDLHLRIRTGRKETVLKKLREGAIRFSLEEDCLILPNGTQIEHLFEPDREVVVQDLNSQKVLDPLLSSSTVNIRKAWDCCAASGGKSILLHDHLPATQLTVSDVRQSILVNLRNRFKRAGITNYSSFVADISDPLFSPGKKFDLVICDAPCSGSGTWARTPEQLRFFNPGKISDYALRQKNIALNACRAVAGSGFFLYITCSVFRKENEEVCSYIEKNTGLELQSMNYLKGYTKKADSLFVALYSAS